MIAQNKQIITDAKQRGRKPQQYNREMQAMYAQYQATMKEANHIDFADMGMMALDLLKNNELALGSVRRRHQVRWGQLIAPHLAAPA